jgi:hypothetical protein
MTESTKIKLRWVAILSILVLIFGSLEIFNRKFKSNMKQEINENKGETIGVIIEYYNGGKSVSKYIKYQYRINDIEYEGAIPETAVPELHDECKKQMKSSYVGAKFKVEYSTKNPHYSRIIIGSDTIPRNWLVFE